MVPAQRGSSMKTSVRTANRSAPYALDDRSRQYSGNGDVSGDVSELAVEVVAGNSKLVEGLLAAELAVGHQDAHRDSDLPVGLQRAGQVVGGLVASGGQQRNRGVRGEDRPGRGGLVGERTGSSGVKVQPGTIPPGQEQAETEHAARRGLLHNGL